MSEGTEQTFSERFNRHGLRVNKAAIVAVAIFAVIILGGTGAMAYGTATGAFYQELAPVSKAEKSHSIRRHGWGGIYIIPTGRSRSYFGGGGRIH